MSLFVLLCYFLLLVLFVKNEPGIVFSLVFSSCGSGLSGEALTEAGHHWVGVDISRHMLGKPPLITSLSFHPPIVRLACLVCIVRLAVAKEREVEGDVCLGDIGEGLCFKPGTFDGAIR